MKKYQFSMDELIILREAVGEYKHLLTPPQGASLNRITNYKMAQALYEQFKADLLGG